METPIYYVRKFFKKIYIFSSLISTRPCAYMAGEVKNISFSKNFASVLNVWNLFKTLGMVACFLKYNLEIEAGVKLLLKKCLPVVFIKLLPLRSKFRSWKYVILTITGKNNSCNISENIMCALIISMLLKTLSYFRGVNDDDEWWNILRNSWPTKDLKPYFQSGLLSEVLTIAFLLSEILIIRIWTCAEFEFRPYWRRGSDNHYNKAPLTTTTWRQNVKLTHSWWFFLGFFQKGEIL